MRSGVDHTVLPANNTTPAFTRSSPGGATTEWTVIAPADEAYYLFIDPVRMKGWVGLVMRKVATAVEPMQSSVASDVHSKRMISYTQRAMVMGQGHNPVTQGTFTTF